MNALTYSFIEKDEPDDRDVFYLPSQPPGCHRAWVDTGAMRSECDKSEVRKRRLTAISLPDVMRFASSAASAHHFFANRCHFFAPSLSSHLSYTVDKDASPLRQWWCAIASLQPAASRSGDDPVRTAQLMTGHRVRCRRVTARAMQPCIYHWQNPRRQQLAVIERSCAIAVVPPPCTRV